MEENRCNSHSSEITLSCAKGHTWKATLSQALALEKKGDWCPYCSGKRIDREARLREMQELAKERGGKLISDRYTDSSQKYGWQCRESHVWNSVWNSVKGGTWCPFCAGKKVDLEERIGYLEEQARRRGGILISEICPRVDSEIRFKCKRKHVFATTYDAIRYAGSWCPKCRESRGERITRLVLQQMLGCELPKRRPRWLRATSGRKMEFDGYSEKNAIAFEYQGAQHYQEIKKYFHKSNSFKEQQERDQRKRQLAEERGIRLLEIEGVGVNIGEIPQKAELECKRFGLTVLFSASEINIDQLDLAQDEQYEVLNRDCEQKGLQLLSRHYVSSKYHYEVRCKQDDHVYRITPDKLRRSSGCRVCVQKSNLENMRLGRSVFEQLAHKMGGQLLSPIYANVDTKMEWKCSKGHRFEASGDSVKSKGTWCPLCAGTQTGGRVRPDIEYFKALAAEKEGECLSDCYTNAHIKLMWRCKRGHEWEASANSVKRGSWCRKCRFIHN